MENFMVKPMHANEAFASDYIAESNGAINPRRIVFRASEAANLVKFPSLDLTLDDLLGQRATEALLSNLKALDARLDVQTRVYHAKQEIAFLTLIAAHTPSAIAMSLRDARSTFYGALKDLRGQDNRLKDLSDEQLSEMSGNIQTAIEQSVSVPQLAQSQSAGMRLAHLGGSAPQAADIPRRR